MKAILCFLTFCWLAQAAAFGQAATNAPAAAQAVAPEPAAAPEPINLARPAPEKVPTIVFDADFPLGLVLTNLAEQAGVTFVLAPDLLTNGVPVDLLGEPVGAARFENITFGEALQRVLAKNELILGRDDKTGQTMIGTTSSGLLPIFPPGTEPGSEEPELSELFPPDKEVPLLTMIHMLGQVARLNLLVDPRLKTGGTRQVGTNIIELPKVATNTVSLSMYGGVTAKQTLEAVLHNYGLVLIFDPKTGYHQVTYKDPTAKEPVYTYVMPLRYSNTTNIATLVKATFPQTTVQSDVRTAQLVLLATENEYFAISNLVVALDSPTKQVLIEARFLETFTNPKSIRGIDWTDTLSAQNITMGNGILSGTKTTSSTTTSPGTPVTTTLPSGRQITTTPGSDTKTTVTDSRESTLSSTAVSLTSRGGFSPNVAFLQADGVKAVLSFLNTESDSRVLATPRAVTLDNQETRLEVTRAIPIFDASEAISQGGAAVSSSKPNYTNIGTILVVTPRISGTNVAMKVRPEISKVEPVPSRKVVAGKVNEADIFATSKIETQVMIPSGHTLVMGGLISDSTQKAYTKVPLLGDIPGLGWAFRRESKENSKANLILFVTPTIIEADDYQPYRTEFLNSDMPEHDQLLKESALDRGKPKDWKTSRQKASEADAARK